MLSTIGLLAVLGWLSVVALQCAARDLPRARPRRRRLFVVPPVSSSTSVRLLPIAGPDDDDGRPAA